MLLFLNKDQLIRKVTVYVDRFIFLNMKSLYIIYKFDENKLRLMNGD